MSGAAILALGAAFCFALALILTQYGLRTVPSWRSPLYTIGGSMVMAWPPDTFFESPRGWWIASTLVASATGAAFQPAK